jgi:DnaJ-class molecular chaperone
LGGALIGMFGGLSIVGEASRLDSIEIEMTDQTKDCEAYYGTGNEPRMRAVQPGRKILFRSCPACGGTGKAPKSPASAPERE